MKLSTELKKMNDEKLIDLVHVIRILKMKINEQTHPIIPLDEFEIASIKALYILKVIGSLIFRLGGLPAFYDLKKGTAAVEVSTYISLRLLVEIQQEVELILIRRKVNIAPVKITKLNFNVDLGILTYKEKSTIPFSTYQSVLLEKLFASGGTYQPREEETGKTPVKVLIANINSKCAETIKIEPFSTKQNKALILREYL